MKTPPQLPEGEIQIAGAGYHAAVKDLPPALSAVADAWLETIRPPHWALEWSLPYWVGEHFGLPSDITRQLVLANVLGLAYIRLQDALADGEVAEISPPLAPPLATALHQRWVGVLRGALGGEPRFWICFERYLTEWVWATADAHPPSAREFRAFRAADFLHLAHRGAPLKSCCAAAALLAGESAHLPAWEAAVDYLLVAAVLLDHLQDWAADLAAERWNAFVAYASPLPQTTDRREANQLKVLEELYVAGRARPYLRIVRRYLHSAGRALEPIGCPGLAHYLDWLAAQTTAYSHQFGEMTAARLRDATQQLLGDSPGVAS